MTMKTYRQISILRFHSIRIALFLLIGTILFLPSVVLAKNNTVESVASDIAKQHNDRKMTDDMTLTSTAEARGKHVIFTNVLRVQKDVPKHKLDEFRSELYNDIVPKTCKVNSENVAFTKMGLYYTFIYFNKYNQKLAEITVDKDVCNKLR